LTTLLDLHWLTVHGLIVLIGMGVYAFASHAWHQRRHPSAAIAWVVSLALLPYLALPLYLLIGNRKIVRSLSSRLELPAPGTDRAKLASPPASPADRLRQLAGALGLPPAATYRDLQIHANGQAALDALRTIIDSAHERLDVCTFLLGRDAFGLQLSAWLTARAHAGVRVRLLIDSVGLYLAGRPNLAPLKQAGVEVVLFVPPWRSALRGRTNLRNHRKMVIADGARLWTGGRNLAAEYFVGDQNATLRKSAWTDLSYDLSGELVDTAQRQFDQDWAFACGAPLPELPPRQFADPEQQGAQFIPSGPDQAEDTLYALLVSSCFTARDHILAVTPYYVPDATLQMALTLAALRGVRVDLILPSHSNHRLADVARNAPLRELATAGAYIWQTPEMIHAKAIVIDDDLAIAGSANLDERSLFLNYEMMIAFFAPADVRQFSDWIAQQRQRAQAWQPRAPSLPRKFVEGLVRWLAFQI
jgi:cardiolipin synthase